MKRILIIEDEELIARAYQAALTKEGYEVVLVTDGADAEDVMRGCEYDLILLDLILPGVNGFEILAEKRKQGLCKDTKVIVLSNLGQVEDKEKALQLGADEYLVKADQSIGDVLQKVKEVVES